MPYEGLNLDGKVALVTGSARGIGEALAVGLAQAGASVAISDMPSRLDLAQSVQRQIEALGNRAGTYTLDVLDLANIQETMGRVVEDFGRLDILVNNAGIRIRKPALEVTEDDWDVVVDTNLKGVFFCAQAAARVMIAQGGGRIINIASQLAVVARPDRAAYCASKAGGGQPDPGLGPRVGQGMESPSTPSGRAPPRPPEWWPRRPNPRKKPGGSWKLTCPWAGGCSPRNWWAPPSIWPVRQRRPPPDTC